MATATAAMPQVISEIVGGDGLGLGAASRIVPAFRGEGRSCPSTLSRWIRNGLLTPDGRVVKLEAARIGGRWLTSRAALARFATALTPPAGSDTSPVSTTIPRTETVRRKACE